MYKTIKIRAINALFVFIFIISACTYPTIINYPLYEYPQDWKNLETRNAAIEEYSKYLSGKEVFIDPGHGGEDRRNTNKKGDVVEADVNLRVGVYLKQYLTGAGVEVFMSRESDKTVPLLERSELANNSGADIFVSIHHNAPAAWENDWTNYTSTYYHAKETDYEYEPFERDLARYIQRDLSYVMRNPGGLGSFDGTYSDYNIYPGKGFAVLRNTTIPAVLVECAFHTNRLEELRLNNEEFNRIQAWGIFRGIAKFFRDGFPQIELLSESIKYNNNIVNLSFLLKDSSGINPRSIQVFIDKEEIEFQYDRSSGLLSFNIISTEQKEFTLQIICANNNGIHALPFHKTISVKDNQIILQ